MSMDLLYPASPANVPPDLTKPTSKYKRHAWLAMAAITVFILSYLAISGWLIWTSFRLFTAAANGADFGSVFLGAVTAFLALFLIKSLFLDRQAKRTEDVEITNVDQPRLFEFLNRLADEIGAPRPRRVYLSARVNACVFYDLSIASLIFPFRKNLEIGLGLVNVLSIGEFKAVLAHEFGHFAQRTMAVGRWVYVAQQIASRIVAKRDAFDALLSWLSRVDLRVAWIGWMLRVIVWAIRSLIETAFEIVVLAERALSREMEFQADLVSVSVTGSDALINSLYKLNSADDALSRAGAFALSEQRAGGRSTDIFALQNRVIELMRAVLNDPSYCTHPEVPQKERERYRLFATSITAPPAMWATHPSNLDREENAKRNYVAAEIDRRSAWDLFDNVDDLKAKISNRFSGGNTVPAVDSKTLMERLDGQYARDHLRPKYRGAYLWRSAADYGKSLADLYGPAPSDVRASLTSLYPESLAAAVSKRRALGDERNQLRQVKRESSAQIKYRGQDISASELTALAAKIESDYAIADLQLQQHDRACRAAHLAAARSMGSEMEPYLRALLSVHHYASHTERDLRDAKNFLNETLTSVFSRRGKASNRDREAILSAAASANAALKRAHDAAPEVTLDPPLLKRLEISSWAEGLGELKLGPLSPENLGQWLEVSGSWLDSAIGAFASLRQASLDQLLETEEAIESSVLHDGPAPKVEGVSRVPETFKTLCPGEERVQPPREPIFGLSFLSNGVVGPRLETLGRVVAALCVVGTLVWVGQSAGHSTVTIYNGLGRELRIDLGPIAVDVPPFGHRAVEVADNAPLHVRASATDGRVVDEFDASISGYGVHQIYNVAGAGVLLKWVAVYGNAPKVPEQTLGTARWSTIKADVVFEEPPTSVSTKGGGATRSVLTGFGGEDPVKFLGIIQSDPGSLARVVNLHSNWDEEGTPYLAKWREIRTKIH